LVVNVPIAGAQLHHTESRRCLSACQTIAGIAFIEVFEASLMQTSKP
jgi:hypothetical protein